MENDFNFIKGQLRVFNTLIYKDKYKEQDTYTDMNKEWLIKILKVSQDI